MAHTFTTRGLVSFGWEKTKAHYWFLLKVAFIFIVLSGAGRALPVLGGIVQFVLSIALLSLSFAVVDGKHLSLEELLKPFETHKVLWHAFLATLLYGLFVILGLLLLLLPGIYVAVRLKFYLYEIIEHPAMLPMESIKKSWHLTKGVFWKLVWINIILVLLNILGALLLGIGLFVTVPITIIAYTKLYRELERAHEHVLETVASPHIA